MIHHMSIQTKIKALLFLILGIALLLLNNPGRQNLTANAADFEFNMGEKTKEAIVVTQKNSKAGLFTKGPAYDLASGSYKILINYAADSAGNYITVDWDGSELY